MCYISYAQPAPIKAFRPLEYRYAEPPPSRPGAREPACNQTTPAAITPRPPHPKPIPTGKPAAPPVLATDTAGIPERKATTRVRQMPAKFPTMTAARKHAAKMVSWQCPTKSRQRIISDAAAARSTTPSG